MLQSSGLGSINCGIGLSVDIERFSYGHLYSCAQIGSIGPGPFALFILCSFYLENGQFLPCQSTYETYAGRMNAHGGTPHDPPKFLWLQL